jgi:serine/threonine protein phosphatase PrpC
MAVANLIDAANMAGGTDNITVLALQCLSGSSN